MLSEPRHGLWAVADGLGGHNDGHRASALLVAALAESSNASHSLERRIDTAAEAAMQVNEALRADVPDDEVNSGTTLVALVADTHGEAACLWVGDSRAYHLRGGVLSMLSVDHVAEGSQHVLTRAVGAEAELEIDVRSIHLLGGDQILLCSDGLYAEVSAELICDLLASARSAQTACRQLIDSALSGPCQDNASCVLVRFDALD